jgi:uncharacterized protein (DUF1800 family)
MSLPGFVAVARFGLGARPGEIAAASSDPRGWAHAQLVPSAAMPPEFEDLTRGQTAAANFTRIVRRGNAVPEENRRNGRAIYREEVEKLIAARIASTAPLRERLVAFWANHFTVSVQRAAVLPLAGAFEREAIRPNVLGRFRDMLIAVLRHPAMLIYLDQARSIGPNSVAGRRRERGLNENLAREILELHTLGVDGGYVQDDVTGFAQILTGWSIARDGDPSPGAFMFRPTFHEPGPKSFLGHRFAEAGESEGVAALETLARHPATARRVAEKLVRHFVADRPPEALVARLARRFLDTDGDLGAVTRMLVDAPEAWSAPLTKFKTPIEFVVSAQRAVADAFDARRLLPALRQLGQAPFAAPSPAGWPDGAEHWLGPESIMRRAEWAMALAGRVGHAREPREILDRALGPAASADTRYWQERAASAVDAIALVFASPEFQRR